MKILYAIQGTGNGHLSRARDIIPLLQQKGELDILVSGIQADVELPYPVKYKFNGLSFIFGKKGGVDLLATYRKSQIRKLYQEIKSLPIEQYDLIINDFEPVSAWACKLKNKPCIGLSHQAAVINSKSPRPKEKDPLGMAIMQNYAPVTHNYGFHFNPYDEHISTPVIRSQVRHAVPQVKNHYTVYLPAYDDKRIIKILSEIGDIHWEVFSKHSDSEYTENNVHIRPVNNEAFIDSLINCTGILCGAGFETPAEALFLKKKLMVIPMKGQYEQQCNAAALQIMGIPVIKSLRKKHVDRIKDWTESEQDIPVNYPDITERIIDEILQKHSNNPRADSVVLTDTFYSGKDLKETILDNIMKRAAGNTKRLFTREDFGDKFHWGVSTAAYQIEGGHNADGKGPSIWDTFSQKRKKIAGNHNGNIACDFYHRYEEDISLLNKLNIPNYRFSISWSRILPEGIGAINPEGIAFYNRMIDLCLESGVEPWVTLYHWDLPETLQQKGGWTNREVVNWFSYFTECCVRHFGDRVKNWIILNEPMVFTGAGYFLGVHAPGKKGLGNFLASAHHAALCQAAGGHIVRELLPDSKIGTTFSYSHIEPFSDREKDQNAAKKVDTLLNRMFLEPLLGMGYPTQELKILQRIERYMKEGDEDRLAFQMDFIGLQNYTREVVKYSAFTPFIKAKIIKADQRKVEYTQMNWEVYPQSIYHALKSINAYPGVKEIIVTENGAAFKDELVDGLVQDFKRVNFLKDHVEQVLLARKEGVNVNGYFVWTLLDNFEWAEGFHPRFGLVHVDFETQKRTVKASGQWYSNFIKA